MIDEYPSENFCINCFHNAGVKAWFEQSGELGDCGYCDRQNILVVPIDEFCDFFVQCIGSVYSTPEDAGMSYCTAEGGWLGRTYEVDEIIEAVELETDDEIRFSPIIDYLMSISWLWCQRELYQLSEEERLAFDWKQFKQIVLHHARYVFLHPLEEGNTEHYGQPYNVNQILEEIGRLISEHQLLVTLPVDTTLYRVRIPEANESLQSLEQLCGPEPELAKIANRMSPAGISMFYGAMDQETALHEVIGTPDKPDYKAPDRFTVAAFKALKAITIVDLTALPPYPELLAPASLNPANHADNERLRFLYHFVHEIAEPIKKDGREHIDYVPTQIVTEYLRFIYPEKAQTSGELMGIRYQSAIHPEGQSVVLFLDPPSRTYSDRNTRHWLALENAQTIKAGSD